MRITNNPSIHLAAVALVVALTGATGCNVPAEGNEGLISFTPQDCGRLGCDFANGIGVGGLLEVRIDGIDGYSTAGLELESSNPEVLAVVPGGGLRTWTLSGMAPGTATLRALDADLVEVDYIDVEVLQPERLSLLNIAGDAVGPTLDTPGYDETWQVNVDQRVLFYVTPLVGPEQPVMGRYEYADYVQTELAPMVGDPDVLIQGHLDVTPTVPGSYEVSFTDNYGNSVLALIEVVGATP